MTVRRKLLGTAVVAGILLAAASWLSTVDRQFATSAFQRIDPAIPASIRLEDGLAPNSVGGHLSLFENPAWKELRAQPDPSDLYLTAFLKYRDGQKSLEKGNKLEALVSLEEALSRFDRIAAAHPGWIEKLVACRREGLSAKIAELK